MINAAKYNICLKETKKILKDYQLSKQIYDKKGIFSKNYYDVCLDDNISEIYTVSIKNFDYDILLFDDSIIQFSYRKADNNYPILRYAYYQNPFDVPAYEEYLQLNLGIPIPDFFSRVLEEEYEQLVAEAPPNLNAVALRYDFSIREYTSGIHPVSHIHIGIGNSIRIPTNLYLTPTVFIIFVLKQIYYDTWIELLENESFKKVFHSCKKICEQLENEYFMESDKAELFLS
ncbi:MAG: DUF2290 domain-containing protein [Desulfobacteraceae bacterium]|nr:DUF2290 domain-containing protein [Desulfobacteraceae bacterium]